MELHECFLSDQSVRSRTLFAFEAGHPIVTLCSPESDDPLACVGCNRIFSQVAECWTLLSKDVERYPFYYASAMKRISETAFVFYGLERMQISIKADQEWAHKWAKYLGFDFEGEMKSYGEELVDYFLFAKVRGQDGR